MILIVEDEAKIARFVQLELEHEGYSVKHISDGRAALESALTHDYELIILDLMLPGMSGIELLRRLRQSRDTPVIILTARDQIMDKVAGLDIGANDYMTKPFAIEELLARIRVHLKKRDAFKADRLTYGKLVVDRNSRSVTYDDVPVELTKKVTWPTWDKLQSSALLVMVATLIFAVVIFAMDFAFRHMMTFIYTM